MHELALAQELILILDQNIVEHRLVEVNQITIQIGILSNVIPEALRFCFEASSQGTIYETAELVLEEVPVKALCQSCGEEYISHKLPFCCPNCGSRQANILEGTELVIANLLGKGEEESGGTN